MISRRRKRPTPCATRRSVPSGCLSALWMTVMVPIECSPSARGVSSFGSFWVTAPTRRLPCSASSIRRTEDARPAPSGSTACGKRTVPRSGRIPTTSGINRSVSRFVSVIEDPTFSEEIDGTELPGGGPHERLARLGGALRRRVAAAAVTDVGDEVLDLLLHIDHPASHL